MSQFVILCVDDNTDTQRVLSFILTNAGYQVVTARDGQQGIEKAKAWRPALILMDLMMPGMSGVEAIQRLRQIKSTANIPIVVLSAYQEPALVEEALSAGADNYILKTTISEGLLELVKKYVQIGASALSGGLAHAS